MEEIWVFRKKIWIFGKLNGQNVSFRLSSIFLPMVFDKKYEFLVSLTVKNMLCKKIWIFGKLNVQNVSFRLSSIFIPMVFDIILNVLYDVFDGLRQSARLSSTLLSMHLHYTRCIPTVFDCNPDCFRLMFCILTLLF